MAPYIAYLTKATFDNFTSNNHVNLRLRFIEHLVIYQRDEQSPAAMGKHEDWNIFDFLKKVEMDVETIYTGPKNSKAFGWLDGNQLTHLKFYLKGKIEDKILEDFGLYMLDHQTFSIKDLKLRGVPLKECPMETVIFTSDHLKSMELELDEVKDDEDLLETIKAHGTDRRNPWNELIFRNIEKVNGNAVNKILAHHKDIRSLKFEYQQTKEINCIVDVPNLKEMHFKFEEGVSRTLKDFSAVYSLEVHRLNNDGQMMKLIDFLNSCTNLKVLKLGLISSRTHLTPRGIKMLLTAAKNLEQLYLDAYSDRFEISAEVFELIKTDAKKLKILTLSVDEGQAENFREQMKIFTDTQIHATTLGKVITPTSLESFKKMQRLSVEPATCVWKK